MNYLNDDGDEQESFVKSRWDDPSEEKLGVYPYSQLVGLSVTMDWKILAA